MASGNLGGGSPYSERASLTSSSSSRLLQTSCLHQRRGALFLIKLLSKLTILGLLPSSRAGVPYLVA
jgi:hypothetical protein